MIPASLTAGVLAYQVAVAAAKPLADLTPLQLSTLVAYGTELVSVTDDASDLLGAPLDRPAPTGHPTAMIADVVARLSAANDQATLSDLRGVLGRAVLNLAQGVA